MAKKVAEARLDITAKDKSKTAFNSVQGRLKRMKDAMLSMKGAMVGTMVVGFVAMAKEAAKTADAIGKFSDRAGVTTDSLQKMRFAFDLAGVGVEAVDKAFLTFGKRLGKAHQGIGALAGGLKGGEEALLEKLKATNSTTEALDVMFRAMGNAETQTRKLAIADAAFGMAGLRMTAAFRDGADAFYEAQQRAADLGIVLDEKLIRNAEKMNDELTTVAQVLKLQFTATVLELAPAITSLASSFLQLTIAARAFTSLVGGEDSQLSAFERTVRTLAAGIDLIGEKMARLVGAEGLAEYFRDRAFGSADALITGQKRMTRPESVRNSANYGKNISAEPFEFDFGMDDIFDKMGDKKEAALRKWYKDTLKQEKLEKKVHKSWMDDHYKQAELLRYEVAHGKEKTKNMEALFALERQRGREFTPTESKDTLRAIESSYRIIDQLKTKIKETEIEQQSWKQNNLELMRLKLQFEGDRIGIQVLEEQVALEELLGRDLLPDELETLKQKVELFDELNQRLKLQNDIAAMGERVFDRMGDGMLTAMQRGEDAMESFKNVAVAALFDVQREMFKLFVFAPLKKALFSGLGGLMSPFGGGDEARMPDYMGIPDIELNDIPIITPFGTDPDLPKFASGGYAHGGRMALVGERGPELFMPRVGGTVIPNDQLGGGGVNITLNFSTGVQSTVRAEVMGLMPVISENVKQAVAEARMRGGSFSAAMGV